MIALWSMMQVLKDRMRNEEGQTVVEYALILVLISVVSIGIMTAVGTSVGDVFGAANDALGGAAP